MMENLNGQMSGAIMGKALFSRFYAGLRQIEKNKARDAKLAKEDTGGASNPRKKINIKVSSSYVLFLFPKGTFKLNSS